MLDFFDRNSLYFSCNSKFNEGCGLGFDTGIGKIDEIPRSFQIVIIIFTLVDIGIVFGEIICCKCVVACSNPTC